ncbi:MAG TPA: hypothetical protein VER33_19005 [Polyangiaceae bacterium]|nr:hypothetical protein [Polyangiaceae bacterium]
MVEEGQRRDAINSVFALDKLRASVDDRKDDEDLGPPFSRSERTFLPDILELARQHQIPLTFVRVRTRTLADGVPDDPELKAYQAELRAYLAQHGALFVDMSDASWERPKMYSSTDHIARGHQRRYTRLFVKHLRHVFE